MKEYKLFTKFYKTLLSLLIIGLIITSSSNAQTTTKVKVNPFPIFTLSPIAGVVFPLGELSNGYQAGFTGGLDLGIRINKEVSIYSKVGYYSLTSNNSSIPNSNYLEISAGPRYYFTDPNLRSTFFLEAGVGAYSNSQDQYTLNGVTTEKVSQTNVGVDVGPGATLILSKSMDVILKTKYHMIFNSAGTRSFIATMAGLEFKF